MPQRKERVRAALGEGRVKNWRSGSVHSAGQRGKVGRAQPLSNALSISPVAGAPPYLQKRCGGDPSPPSPNTYTLLSPRRLTSLTTCFLKTNDHSPAQPLAAVTSGNFRHLCPPTPTPVSEQKEKEPGKGRGESRRKLTTAIHTRTSSSRASPTPPKQGANFSLAASSTRCHLLKILCVAELLDGDGQEIAGDIRDHHVGAGGHLGAPVASLLLWVRRGEGR